MIHVLGELFGWPAGIVVGNLIASVLWATPALLHLHGKLNAQHSERLAQAARHHEQVLQAIAARREHPGRLPAGSVLSPPPGSITGMGKERRARGIRQLSPDQVISWLRSAEGERWGSWRIDGLHRHSSDAGMFASVLCDPAGAGKQARWPEPFWCDDLDEFR